MTAAEELVWAAAFVQALAGGCTGDRAAEKAQRSVQILRQTSSGPPAGRNAWQRMLCDFRDGGE